MAQFVDPILAVEGCDSEKDRVHELAHFLQLVTNSSGMLFLRGWPIVFKTVRMLLRELVNTGATDRFCLPIIAVDGENLPPRAGAIFEKLLSYVEIIERFEGPFACAGSGIGRRESHAETCPWIDSPFGQIKAPLGAQAIREALATLLAARAVDYGTENSHDISMSCTAIEPAAFPLAEIVRRLGTYVSIDTGVAVLDLALMAPPDPGFSATGFRELHPGHRLLALLDLLATRKAADSTALSFEELAKESETRLGWRSWRENTRAMVDRVAREISEADPVFSSGVETDRRRLLVALVKHGARWRLTQNHGLCGRPEGWLRFAEELLPLARESGPWRLSPPPGVTDPALRSHLTDASLFFQVLWSPRVRCQYLLTDTHDKCPEFQAIELCPVFPDPPPEATRCGFWRFWNDQWRMPLSFPSFSVRHPVCRKCFGQPRMPSRLRHRFIDSLKPVLPPDHLAAAYGGSGSFNPCLALVRLPSESDPIAEVDRQHELIHAMLSANTAGRLMFICRFLRLAMWHEWAWGRINMSVEDLRRLGHQLEELVREIQESWTPAQEGVAWRHSFFLLRQALDNHPERSDEIRARLRLMNDVVTLGPDNHPLVRGWFWGQRLDERYGPHTYRQVVRTFCDPALEPVDGGLTEWLQGALSRLRQAIAAISEVVREAPEIALGPESPPTERAIALRHIMLGSDWYPHALEKARWWPPVIRSLATCKDLPEGLGAFLRRMLDRIDSDPVPRPITRWAFDVVRTNEASDGFPQIRMDGISDEWDEMVEDQINLLVRLDAVCRRFADRMDSLRLAIQENVPAKETFWRLFADLVPMRSLRRDDGPSG